MFREIVIFPPCVQEQVRIPYRDRTVILTEDEIVFLQFGDNPTCEAFVHLCRLCDFPLGRETMRVKEEPSSDPGAFGCENAGWPSPPLEPVGLALDQNSDAGRGDPGVPGEIQPPYSSLLTLLPPDRAHEWNGDQGDSALLMPLHELPNLFRSQSNGGRRSGALPLDNEGPSAEVNHDIGTGMTWLTPDLSF
jgi:hypothetical protein